MNENKICCNTFTNSLDGILLQLALERFKFEIVLQSIEDSIFILHHGKDVMKIYLNNKYFFTNIFNFISILKLNERIRTIRNEIDFTCSKFLGIIKLKKHVQGNVEVQNEQPNGNCVVRMVRNDINPQINHTFDFSQLCIHRSK